MKPSFSKTAKIKIMAFALFVAAFLMTACGRDNLRIINSADTAMGTVIVQCIYASQETSADKEILDIIDGMETDELSWRLESSEVSVINSRAGLSEGTELSEGLRRILEDCLEVSESSGGAFDITIGGVTELWNIDTFSGMEDSEYILPGQEEISEALNNTGYEKIEIDKGIIYLPQGMSIDLGAVGKGMALDRIRDYLEDDSSVYAAVISVGGSILTYGDKPDGTAWSIGITDPFDTTRSLGMVSVCGSMCISTSGDYERYVEVDGVRYHHIIDPGTGYPADSGVHSVTIITENGMYSDALSTACFVLGEEKGLELAEKYNAEALIVSEDGKISMTEGMKKIFSLSNQ
ncbi:MAG: FAD:protein FMN transferase [Lachnospiraceae bacterium]|nr:FAD:protein FMN transferase [Lachnospiraceae bacterium]